MTSAAATNRRKRRGHQRWLMITSPLPPPSLPIEGNDAGIKVRNILFIALEVFCHLREEKTLAGVLVSALSGCSDSS
jgi:hypothetical protein